MKTILYTKPSCGGCIASKRHLDRRGVEYETRSVLDHHEELLAMGAMQAPVLVVGEAFYTGYRPDVIDAL